ncbi:GNAT family N-acetyltransferase [Candidatus Poribacteria bacterium]|nr:GNAT family N-acetyltransferase [Candidatus Poribacteria bacterium]
MNIERADPAEPRIAAMIAELDAYQSELYPANSNHLVPIAELQKPGAYFVAAMEDGAPLGIGCFLCRGSEYIEIKRVFVPHVHRGRGIAKAIMNQLEARARGDGHTLARLETGIHQPEAIALYERLGYTRCARFGHYPDDPVSVFLEKRLV